ncbi:FeoB small GTPase domain-containing protein [Gorillibacterium timonense]|uniref:FeoB small GTPase domain-containing protein n=1 Tax=Gorillibacterium timonense TaxID=1689269 RepID=UPI00071C9D4B|nr:FeoB small GTPase domain-containing protein [Gorillibacterium timonense]
MNRYLIALAGNPNTGKSTLFNALTGMRQHTGNWAGKTVVRAEGTFTFGDSEFRLVDLPGTYSLFSNSTDEEVARDSIILEKPDATIVVADATSLERHMNLALQVMEMTNRVVLAVNLLDEAEKLGITVDIGKLEGRLGIPVAGISARKKKGLNELLHKVEGVASGRIVPVPRQVSYSAEIEKAIEKLVPKVRELLGDEYPARWLALRILDGDHGLLDTLVREKPERKRSGEVLTHAESVCH